MVGINNICEFNYAVNSIVIYSMSNYHMQSNILLGFVQSKIMILLSVKIKQTDTHTHTHTQTLTHLRHHINDILAEYFSLSLSLSLS